VAPSTDAGGSAGEEHDHASAHPAAGMFLVATVHFSGTMKLQVCDRKPGIRVVCRPSGTAGSSDKTGV